MKAKRFLAMLLTLCLMAGTAVMPALASEPEDGVFEGVGQGFGGDMTVAVTIDGGKITAALFVDSYGKRTLLHARKTLHEFEHRAAHKTLGNQEKARRAEDEQRRKRQRE